MIPTNLNVPMACDSCGGEHVGAAQSRGSRRVDGSTQPLIRSEEGEAFEEKLIDPSSSKNGVW